jgi:mRNA export factor
MNTKNDFELSPACTDGISDLSFSPAADYLAAASWDNQVRIWEVLPSNTAVAKAAIQHDAPALCCTWSKDGTKVFSGGADKNIRMLDVSTGATTPFPAHDMPIKSLRWMNTTNAQALVSGSWDKTVKYWDLRSPNPIGAVQLPERCYSMDVSGDLLVVATAERHVCIINLNNPMQIYKTITSPLKWQTRAVSCYHNGTGFAIGSIEGRVGLHWIDEKQQSLNFAFRCHREGNKAFSVNSISFHPQYGTFVTAGSDGFMHFWDKDSKQRLESANNLGNPIPTTAFSRNGNYLAYALSYDWSNGHEFYQPGAKNSIMIHPVQDSEVKPRGSSLIRRR